MSKHDPRRIVIVGAGIVGVQLARALQLRGLAVTLIDQGDPGMACSYGNAGFIASDEIFPLAHGRVLRSLPRMLRAPLSPLSMRWREVPRLMPWFLRYARACSSSRSEKSIAALALIQNGARDAWERVLTRENLAALMRRNGAWKLFETDRGLADTAHERTIQKTYGIDAQVYSAAALRERIPEIGPSVRHAVFYPDGMNVINPLALTRALFGRFVADGGEFLNERVLGFERRGTRVSAVRLNDAELACDAAVVAAGHLSGRLLEPLGLNVPMVAERGYHVEMSHSEISFDMPVGSHERGFYMTPMTSGLRLAGTSEFSSAADDTLPNWARADILIRHAAELLPGVTERETGRWMGHRPTLCDFLPALGRTPGIEQLYLAFGHQHLGLTLSAITAEIMSELIDRNTTPFDIAPFSLQRFA